MFSNPPAAVNKLSCLLISDSRPLAIALIEDSTSAEALPNENMFTISLAALISL